MTHTREFLVAAIVGALVVLGGVVGLFAPLDARLTDSFVTPQPISSDIVVVAIDDASLAELGQWPWGRATFAEFVSVLGDHRPQALGIDVIFAEQSRLGAADDVALARAFADAEYPIVLAGEASSVRITKEGSASALTSVFPLPEFVEHARVGMTNIIVDPDGIVRRVPLSVTVADDILYPSFASALAEGLLDDALERAGIERIVYSQPSGGVRRVSFSRALKEPELLADKIVLVGATAASLHDEQRTPLDRGTLMPGVEIQANILDMLIEGRALNPVAFPHVIAFLLALAPALLFVWFRRSVEPLIACGVFFVLVMIVANVLFEKGIIVPVAEFAASVLFSSLALFIYRYAKNRRETRALHDAFGRYVAPSVLREILRYPEQIVLGGEERTVTVLFSDIRSFTTLSESMPASELVALLNRYFAAMSREIVATGGVIDKYIGDAIMAFWGAPLEDDVQADNAARAALGMARALDALNAELVEEGKAPLATGIGIATGPAIVGNIGSAERLDYTAIGDTVNTAARLESLTKERGEQIIISASTHASLREPFNISPLGEVSVKGKTKAVDIYAVRS